MMSASAARSRRGNAFSERSSSRLAWSWDQDAAEVVARFRIERLEDGAEVGHSFDHGLGRFKASRAASTDA
jgi:hypothetical protein